MTLSVRICLLALFCGVCQATPPFTSGGSSGGGLLGGILGSILGSGASSGGGAGAADVVNSLLKVKLGVIDLARERVNSRLDQFSGQSESTATAEASGPIVDGQGGGVPAYQGGNNQQYQGNSQGNSQQSNQGYQGNNQQYQGNHQQQQQQQFRPSYPSNQGGDSYTNAAAAGYSSGDSAGVAYDHNAQQIAGSEYSGQGQNYPSNGARDYQSGGNSNVASLSSFGSNDNYDNSGSGNSDGFSSNSFGSSDSFGSTDTFEGNSLSADTKSESESGSSSGSSAGIGGIAELVRSGVNAYRTRINGAFDRASSGLSLINSLGSLLPSLLSSLGGSSRSESFSVGNRGSDDASSSLSF